MIASTFSRDAAGKSVLAVILDGFSRKVVGWALERGITSRLAIDALQQAIAERQPPPGLVHHSDFGVQYASGEYAAVLNQHQMIPSMSRPANPYDKDYASHCTSWVRCDTTSLASALVQSADVGMIEAGDGFAFALEALMARRRVAGQES